MTIVHHGPLPYIGKGRHGSLDHWAIAALMDGPWPWGDGLRLKKLSQMTMFGIKLLPSPPDAWVVERQQAWPKQGLSSTFTTGEGYGALVALATLSGGRLVTPRPAEWTKSALRGVPGEGKARNILAAQRMFPELDLCPGRRTKPCDGLADAALLTVYGKMIFC
jgi:hypothetical protein